ncbi:hypothetical protein [Ornithinibacillus bavariensis]|uniref:hypothetical protein n=1 Tax=Ornithinibacillus bavariensis TaxID=545502 RepID=UPI003D24FA75
MRCFKLNIQQVMGKVIANLRQDGQALRPGQIVQGKIVAIYPNNKAQIQLGTTLLIAQLEAALEVGAKYHFQVQEGREIPQLKVIGEALRQSQLSNAESLLQQFGIKPTKGNAEFVELLLQQKIPFEKDQLQQAVLLLDRAGNRLLAQQVLLEMFSNRMPITPNIYLSLFLRESNEFYSQLLLLEQTLQQEQKLNHQVKQQLMTLLARYTGSSENYKLELVQRLTDNPATFNFLKAIRFINRDMQYSDWGQQLQQTNKQDASVMVTEYNHNRILQVLTNILPKAPVIRDQAALFLQTWGNLLHESVTKGMALPEEQFGKLTYDLQQTMRTVAQQVDFQVLNTPKDLRNIIIDLEILANQENQTKIGEHHTRILKDLFLEQTRNVLTQSGLNYEKVIHQEEMNPQHTLKGLVTQLMQLSDGNTQEVATRLLHFMNGVQLQSIQESDNFLQAQLVIPAGKFGLSSDIELSFEGTKNKDGELNKEFCRIMFFLDLSHIEKTVIDMHVQKRTISLTILNDYPIDETIHHLKSGLKEGLAKIDYQLTSVTYKPLSNNQLADKKDNIPEKQHETYRGVDYRI